MLAEPPGSYFFISIATFVACPALTSTSFVCLPSVSCQASTVYLPGGTFSILALPPPSVTPKNGFGMTATHPSIQLCTSQVSLMNSGFSNFSVITFLNFGCLVDGRIRRRVRMDVMQDVVRVLELELPRRHRGDVGHEL